ncbi:MAG: hypothetical protein IPG12_14095 [Saprospiraceae bacterium]|nr:hypothetical protein [Saprospiraceae bacterium]
MLQKLFSFLASKIFGGIAPKQKTMILGWLTTIVGTFSILFSTESVQKLCEQNIICLDGNAVWGGVLVVIGVLIKILRFVTGQEYGDRRFQ